MPHLHLYNRAGFRDNAAKSGKPGHNRDIGPNSGTVPAKPGHLATMLLQYYFPICVSGPKLGKENEVSN